MPASSLEVHSPDNGEVTLPNDDYFLHKRHSSSLNSSTGANDDHSASWGNSSSSDLSSDRPPYAELPAAASDDSPKNGTVIITIAKSAITDHAKNNISLEAAKLGRSGKLARAFNQHWGSWFSAMSSFFFSWQAVGMKKVSSIHPYELVIFQSGMQVIPSAFILLLQRKNPVTLSIIKKSGWLLVLRGLLGGSASLLRIIAFRNVAMGEVSTLLFASPVFVAVLSPFILKERPSRLTILAVLLTLVGLVLVVQPEFIFGNHSSAAANEVAGNVTVAERNIGLGCAVGAAGVAVGIQLTLRMLRDESEHVVMFWYGTVACTAAVIMTAIFDSFKKPGSDWWLIGLTGGFQYMSQLFQTLAFQMGDSATAVSVVRTTEILWAYIWQVAIFKEPVNLLSLGGAATILSSILLVIYEKYRQVRKERRKKKKERAGQESINTVSKSVNINLDAITLPTVLDAVALTQSSAKA